mmetsp:Transcript_19600/g.47868  ORF Transcript_19600/g.47868 Transcript_19600/m.47868 type:complete len:186 (-) Transcript_19600:337-894(-)|eukprot:CAMPEP_0114500830 /NCGR_PEP_ID=MMETSP0109-20121206/8173_1 /TAXON_ID=29199 /ORGANISM="Chlorarachnion reptans, Strain CCCM449" /LENGTH=185 /DNA_ID=CAMNT_0001678517 /DNA_START=264 /DNA_END=821 /DNA_ORIENTATION=+
MQKCPLLGMWALSRTVKGVNEIIAKASGTAAITRLKEDESQRTLLYTERGEMIQKRDQNLKIPFFKTYYLLLPAESKYEEDTAGKGKIDFLPLKIYFTRDQQGAELKSVTEGSHYVTFEDEAVESKGERNSKDVQQYLSTEHLCGEDRYTAKLQINSDGRFLTECIVKGPKKDLVIESEYASSES